MKTKILFSFFVALLVSAMKVFSMIEAKTLTLPKLGAYFALIFTCVFIASQIFDGMRTKRVSS